VSQKFNAFFKILISSMGGHFDFSLQVSKNLATPLFVRLE